MGYSNAAGGLYARLFAAAKDEQQLSAKASSQAILMRLQAPASRCPFQLALTAGVTDLRIAQSTHWQHPSIST